MTQPRKTTAKKAVAKKTAAAKAETIQKQAAEKQEGQPGVAIANQAAFAGALGLNPDTIVPNSMRVEFNPQGVAMVVFTAVMGVSPQQLAYAFMASSGMVGDGADGQSREITDEPDTGE